MIPKYKGLAIEGGGVLGMAYIGALQEYVNCGGDLNSLTHFAGTSAGSILAGLLSVRMPLEDMHKIIFDLDFNMFLDDDFGIVRDTNRLINQYGWYRGDTMRDWYRAILNDVTGIPDITFEQAHNIYGTYLCVTKVSVEVPKSKLVIMDYMSCPSKPIYQAVRESSSIPLFFKACIDEAGVYVDGGIILNYPIPLLESLLPIDQIIGLWITDNDEQNTISRPVSDIMELVKSLFQTLRELTINRTIKDRHWAQTVKINVYDQSAINFDLTDLEKKILFDCGAIAMLEFLNNIS